ncbi:hypothetical protein DFH29DRAFT_879272 [Suillus ampliporus]|nr:hypothetical protein DFH29DRAFT_879272 [Suillus ampliporus]
MAMETALPTPQLYSFDDVGEDLTVVPRPGRLCQEGIDDAQELGHKTLEAAKAIGEKYGKSACMILIEARLSVKHSRAETPWNMHQGWYKGKYPREKDELIGERDSTITTTASQTMTHCGMTYKRTMSFTWAVLMTIIPYSRLEGIEVIGCVFDTTPDEAARQASGFVAGSSTFMDIINECQVDARLTLDWIVTAAKAKNYQLALLQFGGAYDILFSKSSEAPWDRYQRIWPVMVLEKLEQFGYKTKSVQWWKLLDVAYQNKFQFELWPDEVHPVGPDFNYHTLSTQHLKLLVMPYIKRRAKQYYDAELKTEAENLLELQRKQGRSDKTLDDIIDELDITVSEIDIVPWPKDHIEQCEKHDPKMFDIPVVTSTSNIMLQKLVDSEKFKYSVPKVLLQQYKEATSTSGSNVSVPSGERQREDTSRDHQSQQQTCERRPAVLQSQRMQPHKRPHVEDYGKSTNHSLADPLLIEFPADDQQFESEADSLNAPDSCIRKKSKVVHHHDGALHIKLPSQHFVPTRPQPRAPTPDYEPPQHWHNEAPQEWLQEDTSIYEFYFGSSQGLIDGSPYEAYQTAGTWMLCKVRQQAQEGLVIWWIYEE